MHKIDIHNYEAYLLDFLEGNLTGGLQVELELFLIQHPELDINLNELSLVTLENEATSFSNKNSLKKSETDLVSEEQFIAYIENQLSENERLDLEKSCAINPTLSKELALYTRTIAKPDASVVFENKQSLKSKSKLIWFNFSTTQYATAACVAFLIGLFVLWPKTNLELNGLALVNTKDLMKTYTIPSIQQNNIASITNANDLIASKGSNSSSIQNSSTTKSPEAKQLLANNKAIKKYKTSSVKDTLHPIINNSPIVEFPINETQMALNVTPVVKPKTVVQVITENDDDAVAVNTDKKKKGIWATASRALKNLNHAGVKAVNGDEEDTKDNTAYAITLGGVSITHKAGL